MASDPSVADEKSTYGQPFEARPPLKKETGYKTHLLTRCIPALVVLAATYTLFRSFFVSQHHYSPGAFPPFTGADDTSHAKVELEAHGMSRCPDYADCLRQLIVPTMIQVGDKVNFTLSFIGRIDPKSDAVSCMHGPAECLGNIIELCAAKVYPDPKTYLGFANCLASDYHDIPDRDLVEGCAMEHAVDFQRLNSCISDEGEGIDLLRASIQRSQENHVTKSCTVRLAGKIRCIRDGGKWYDCPGGSSVDDLVREINQLYHEED